MSDTNGGLPGTICPIISAVSELKQFSEYPKCNEDCGWFDQRWRRCGLLSISVSLEELRTDVVNTSSNVLSGLDWQTKQDIKDGIRALGDVLQHLMNNIS